MHINIMYFGHTCVNKSNETMGIYFISTVAFTSENYEFL